MQNSDAAGVVASSSFKKRRPNILRKKSKRQSANPPTNITGHQSSRPLVVLRNLPNKTISETTNPVVSFIDSSFIQTEKINIINLQDELASDSTNTSCISHSETTVAELIQKTTGSCLASVVAGTQTTLSLPESVTASPKPASEIPSQSNLLYPDNLIAEFDDVFLSDGLVINKSRGSKTFPRKRWPSQRIILDTYVCDKKRVSQQNQHTNTRPAVSESLALEYSKCVLLQDAEFPEDTSLSDLKQEVAEAEPSTLPRDDAPLDPEVALSLLRAAGLTEEPQLLVDTQGQQHTLWLCPVPDCNRLYGQKDPLYHHILTHFDLNIYTCNTAGCNKTYISQTQLDEHQLSHQIPEETPDEEAEDGVVPAPEDPSSELAAERRKKARRLVAEALASVGVSEDLVQSELLDDGTRSWPCPELDCQLSFKTHYLLKNHILAHYDLRPFKCSHVDCGWAFRSLGKLRVHTATHAGASRHACLQAGCRKAFSTKYNLAAHVARAHATSGGRIACPARACTRMFAARSELEVHLNTEHMSQHAVNRCGICGKRFWWTSGLAAHARTHAHPPGELLCYWPGCGRRFPQPCRLRYHLRTHTGDKPYRCTHPSCNWAFPSASKLRRHARAHAGAGGRRHTCPVCGRSFLRAEHLREHQPRHLPHRHHACDHPGCDEKFSNKSSVYVHKKRQHGADGTHRVPRAKKTPKGKTVIEEPPPLSVIHEPELCAEELLSLRSARTHVPWGPLDLPQGVTFLPHQPPHLLQHLTGCDEKQGNPLVCGGLELEGEGEGEMGGTVGAELCLGGGVGGDDGEPTGLDLNINSLLMQEELSDGILYATEDEAALQVMLLNEDSRP